MSTSTISPEVINQAFEKFHVTLSSDLKQKLNGRLERGLAISMNNGVTKFSDPNQPDSFNLYKVVSSDVSKPPYLVDLHRRSCTCPDHWKGHFCKHRIAANIISIANQLSKAAATPPPVVEEAEPDEKPAPPPSNGKLPMPHDNATVWGVVWANGSLIGVEVLAIDNEDITIRALPKIVDGKKLMPQFPFEGNLCLSRVHKDEIFHVKVFRNAMA